VYDQDGDASTPSEATSSLVVVVTAKVSMPPSAVGLASVGGAPVSEEGVAVVPGVVGVIDSPVVVVGGPPVVVVVEAVVVVVTEAWVVVGAVVVVVEGLVASPTTSIGADEQVRSSSSWQA
jgi:hypothetical protein